MSGHGEQSADSGLDEILSSIRRIISDDGDRPVGRGADHHAQHGNGQNGSQGSSQGSTQGSISQNGNGLPSPQQNTGTPSQPVTPQTPLPYQAVQADEPMPRVVLQQTIQPVEPNTVAVEPRFAVPVRPTLREGLAPFDRASDALPAADPVPEPVAQSQALQAATPNGSAHADGASGTRLDQPIVLPTDEPLLNSPVAFLQDEAPNGQVTQPVESNGPQVNADDVMELIEPVSEQEAEAVIAAAEPVQPTPDPGSTAATGPTQPAADAPAPELNAHAGNDSGDNPQQHDVAEPSERATEIAANEPLSAAPVADPEPTATEPTGSSVIEALAPASTGKTATSLEATVTSLLKPMLREWLDANMPRLIEEALREDVDQGRPHQSPDA